MSLKGFTNIEHTGLVSTQVMMCIIGQQGRNSEKIRSCEGKDITVSIDFSSFGM